MLDRLLGSLFILSAHGAAFAVCLNPFGCQPKNYEDCVAEATKRPTELGVKLARQECYGKWKQAEDQKKEAERHQAAERRATLWERLPEQGPRGIAGWIGRLGQPDLVLGPERCSPLKGERLPGVLCYSYHWRDDRPGRVDAYFKVEVLDDNSKTIWAYWRDSR